MSMPGCVLNSTCISSRISSVAHHKKHTDVFVVYLLMQELFVDKIHFYICLSKWQTTSIPARSYYCYSCSRGASFSESFHCYEEGEIPCAKNKYEASATSQAYYNFLPHGVTCIPRIMYITCQNCLNWST